MEKGETCVVEITEKWRRVGKRRERGTGSARGEMGEENRSR